MSQPQPQSPVEIPLMDSSGSFDLVMDDPGDTTVRSMDPHLREQLERWQQRQRENLLDERCSIAPENLKKLRIAAERLGYSEGDLICAGLDLIIEKYRDKLGDLANPQPPSDGPKPDNGPPSS